MNKSRQITTITLAATRRMAQTVEARALEINVPVISSVVDHGGNTLLIQHMSDAFIASCDISLDKTYTARYLRQGAHEVIDVVQPGASLYSLQLTNQQHTAILGGDLPVILNDRLIGTVGVSGGAVGQDILLTEAALDCFSGL